MDGKSVKSVTRPGKALLTPKDLAEAIGASESALRRWVDGGRIRVARTAGGHRRIPLAEAIRFIRQTGSPVIRPELLGLPELPGADATSVGGADPAARSAPASDADRLFAALHAGDAEVARGLVLSAYLAGTGLAALFDGPLRSAIERIGALWQHEARGIMIEHRATEICIAIVSELRGLLPKPQSADEDASDVPLAIGGAPEGDPYRLPSMMAAAVLAETGFRDVNFGAATPVHLLAHEAVVRGARLVWLSVSAQPQDPVALTGAIRKLAGDLAEEGIELILGGRFSSTCLPRARPNVKWVATMSDLSTAARALRFPTSG